MILIHCFLPSAQQDWYRIGHPTCFPSSSDGKASGCNAGDLGSIPGLLGKEMATHSIILAWRIQRTEEPDWLQRGLKESDTMGQVTCTPNMSSIVVGFLICIRHTCAGNIKLKQRSCSDGNSPVLMQGHRGKKPECITLFSIEYVVTEVEGQKRKNKPI